MESKTNLSTRDIRLQPEEQPKRNSQNKQAKIKTIDKECSISDDSALMPFVNSLMREVLFDGSKEIVIVCFGTMQISGDSLGPQVGSLLTKKYNIPTFVYGTEDSQVNGKNMKEWMSFINEVHKGAFIIAVDASLGAKAKVGDIIIREDGVCPAGVKGSKTRFGDIGVLCIVAQNSVDPLMQLMTVSVLYITKLADKLANMLFNVLSQH